LDISSPQKNPKKSEILKRGTIVSEYNIYDGFSSEEEKGD